MIVLYVLLVMAVAALGNQDLEEICPSEICLLDSPSRFSNKPAPNLQALLWRNCSDLEVVKTTPNLEQLEVYNCSSDFKMNIFPLLPALEYIQFRNCSISELQKHQFNNVINLYGLILTGNSIEILSNETFHNLSHLWELDLQNNLIQDLPEGVFNPLESLYRLNLNNNNISMLPKDIFLRNLKLKMISLRENPLKIVTLDFPIWSNKTISSFDLSDCRELRDLRLSIKVGHLYLKNSGVERLQITGRILRIDHENSKVTRADLSGTYFDQLYEPALCDMPSLESLDLSNTSAFYHYLHYALDENKRDCKFPNLRSLNLAGNDLDYISRGLPFFGPNLTTLDLSQNLLDESSLGRFFNLDIPKGEEGHIPNLRFLHMAHNKLKKIPRSNSLFGPNLTTLDLSYNLLEDLSLESLAKAHNLQSLFLEGNQLTSFDYLSLCDGLKNLKRLALYDNMFNATFYHNMTKYLGDQGLQLIEKEHRIFIEAENQKKTNA